jgi:polar amino acid transport system substrate-binding protein
MGQDLHKEGYFSEISRQAFQKAGYEMSITWMPWQRALNAAKTGRDFDGVLGAGHSEERAKSFEYTDPIDTDTYVFFTHKDNKFSYEKPSDLKPYTIGGMRGDIAGASLKTTGFNIIETATFEQSIKMVLAKRIDFFIASKRVIQSILNTKFKQQSADIVALSPSYKEYSYYIIISKRIRNHKSIAQDFNLGLKQIKEDGTVGEILHDFGFGE